MENIDIFPNQRERGQKPSKTGAASSSPSTNSVANFVYFLVKNVKMKTFCTDLGSPIGSVIRSVILTCVEKQFPCHSDFM